MMIETVGTLHCAILQTWTLWSSADFKVGITAVFDAPVFFGGRKGVESTMKPKVSPITVSKGAGVPEATGPHSLLTNDRPPRLSPAILSLATLLCRTCDGPGPARTSASS